jgi:hypothetical protein
MGVGGLGIGGQLCALDALLMIVHWPLFQTWLFITTVLLQSSLSLPGLQPRRSVDVCYCSTYHKAVRVGGGG